jgi:flagellar M-ring protein FliF
MSEPMNQFLQSLSELPLAKKGSMVFIFSLIVAGFVLMFYWANQEDYQVLFSNLSPKDGGAVVSKLQEKSVPYKVGAGGATIMVPAEKVYELRLTLAGEGLPSEGKVGFEIFDDNDFRTTKFVQELNYRRALQGELTRSINQFKEVKASNVFIVIPKDTLFVEDKKPASASIQLDLKSNLPAGKLAAIVHLVANAVEGLAPGNVTVVDTKGRIIFKGTNTDDASYLLSDRQLEYKKNVETVIRENVQSMLEGIVGFGKAIVRVTAEIDFNKITLSEEQYDPNAKVVRSERNIEESTMTGGAEEKSQKEPEGQRAGVASEKSGGQNSKTRKDIATNYEINKVSRSTLKPAGTVKRLSVAAVIDGTYKNETLEDGTVKKTYIPRNAAELQSFEEIVKKAMGYSEDREDQVAVNSISFVNSTISHPPSEMVAQEVDILTKISKYRKSFVNLILIVLVFFLIVRPLLRSVKTVSQQAVVVRKEITNDSGEVQQTMAPGELDLKGKVYEISKTDPEKAHQLIKGWIGEQE